MNINEYKCVCFGVYKWFIYVYMDISMNLCVFMCVCILVCACSFVFPILSFYA